MATRPPQSDDEWAIHSINIHGVFFERWCQQAIAASGRWKIKATNYPVEYPPPNGLWRGKESTLDIRAEHQHGDLVLTVLIECKKNNPDFVDWVFFPNPGARNFVFAALENIPSDRAGWSVNHYVQSRSYGLVPCDEARETRGSYMALRGGDKTKTSNAAISDAAHQVALATRASADDEARHSAALGSAQPAVPMPYRKIAFLPVIVTSARIRVCEFDPKEVDPRRGEIPFDKVKLHDEPVVAYQYAVPRHLQTAPRDLVKTLTTDALDSFVRMPIFVIQSARVAEVLDDVADAIENMLGKTTT